MGNRDFTVYNCLNKLKFFFFFQMRYNSLEATTANLTSRAQLNFNNYFLCRQKITSHFLFICYNQTVVMHYVFKVLIPYKIQLLFYLISYILIVIYKKYIFKKFIIVIITFDYLNNIRSFIKYNLH